MLSTTNNNALHKFYDNIWQDAFGYFQTGSVEIDPILLNRQNDHRRGLSVIARLSDDVTAKIGEMLDDLKKIDCGQHFYRKDEIHITILSLFTATADFEAYMANYSDYLSAVNSALFKANKFQVNFTGITASKSAVMVQGFPDDSLLDEIREKLRQNLREKRLGEGLDRRYRIKTAHSTVMRFQKQSADIGRLVERLKAFREVDFGTTAFTELELVKNDWYMSKDKVEVLARYSLY
jgi:2'-5' RNA ligase